MGRAKVGEGKPYSKSLRYSETVKDIIENFKEGEGFNDKFERLTLFCFTRIPKVEAKLKNINKEISSQEKRLEQLNKEILQLERVKGQFNDFYRYIEAAKKSIPK